MRRRHSIHGCNFSYCKHAIWNPVIVTWLFWRSKCPVLKFFMWVDLAVVQQMRSVSDLLSLFAVWFIKKFFAAYPAVRRGLSSMCCFFFAVIHLSFSLIWTVNEAIPSSLSCSVFSCMLVIHVWIHQDTWKSLELHNRVWCFIFYVSDCSWSYQSISLVTQILVCPFPRNAGCAIHLLWQFYRMSIRCSENVFQRIAFFFCKIVWRADWH